MKSGIFLISPDEVSLFSMRDTNVGTRNLIAEQRPNRLRLAFEGEPALVPPVISDTPLPGPGDRMIPSLPTMFLATPVRSDDGSVIAVLAVRLDPAADFTRLFRAGRIGVSGETYAFDREGRLLSDSRFDRKLVDIGLRKPDGLSILEVRIGDPGRRLSAQQPADQGAGDLPLTLMASHAVQGQAGVNVDGYRDYRGVPVLGSWTWDDQLDFGIVCEIDESEALGVFKVTRAIVVTMLAVTTLLAFALAAYMSKIRKLSERKAQETAIREREERFSSLVQNIPGAVYRCEMDGNWTMSYISERIEEISGYPAADFVQNSMRSYASIIHPDDVEMVNQAVEKGLREKSFYLIEYRIVRSDGAIRWMFEKGKAIRGGEMLEGV